jgi:hypothetical protein
MKKRENLKGVSLVEIMQAIKPCETWRRLMDVPGLTKRRALKLALSRRASYGETKKQQYEFILISLVSGPVRRKLGLSMTAFGGKKLWRYPECGLKCCDPWLRESVTEKQAKAILYNVLGWKN